MPRRSSTKGLQPERGTPSRKAAPPGSTGETGNWQLPEAGGQGFEFRTLRFREVKVRMLRIREFRGFRILRFREFMSGHDGLQGF